MKSAQLELFDWAQSEQSAVILDWHEPFAAKVMSRIHEYDDDRPKPFNTNTVTPLAKVSRPRPAMPRCSGDP